ncbi:MAG: isoprenylcysteine carboxylmethyltransferase family protein [Planctomycetota bacterium]|nr:isoprenylcysteine carboxylmethyltransferase family protein [Planctomycetota bacterium]MDA1212274.1 isoprenylcysteine carboxylmethyltransferase family protein [Planctomycetota bacterium]
MSHSPTPSLDNEHNMIVRRMADEGQWIFRYRSVLPLLLILPAAWSMANFRYLGDSHELQHLWGWCCVAVSFAGYLLRMATVGYVPGGTSGRNTRSQRADSLNTTGWYATTRNPLYLGNFLIGLGWVAAPADLLLVLVYVGFFWLYYERVIAAEEEYLISKFGREYTEWAARTPVFVPDVRRWCKPNMTFSLRTVFRREYSALMLIGLVFWIIDTLQHLVVERRLYFDVSWTAFMLSCATVYFVMRFLKKNTTLLDVTGRVDFDRFEPSVAEVYPLSPAA